MENGGVALMRASVKEIEVPMTWDSESDWDSHSPMLWLCLENTEKGVMEIGSGLGSTPRIRQYCNDRNRHFRSFETNMEWANKTGATYLSSYLSGHEKLAGELFKKLLDLDFLFVDCAPGELRREIIEAYANIANVIAVHDSEDGAQYVYGMAEILSTFKYRLDYTPEGKPHTSIVSNFINVAEWKDLPSCI